METKYFENAKNQIGCCEIWCGSCIVGNGILRELTKRYEELIKGYDLKDWTTKDFDFEQFEKGFSSIQALPVCPGCLKEGGRPDCEIRACVSERNISDCTECDQPEACKSSELAKRMRTGALLAGLSVKSEDIDSQKLIEKWTEEMKGKFPNSILFERD